MYHVFEHQGKAQSTLHLMMQGLFYEPGYREDTQWSLVVSVKLLCARNAFLNQAMASWRLRAEWSHKYDEAPEIADRTYWQYYYLSVTRIQKG